MSRQNKVNPGMYTQRGRLTQDDAARELTRQRTIGSRHTWQPVQRDQMPKLAADPDAAADDRDNDETPAAVEKKPARAKAKPAPARSAKPAQRAAKTTARKPTKLAARKAAAKKPTTATKRGKAKTFRTAKPKAKAAKRRKS